MYYYASLCAVVCVSPLLLTRLPGSLGSYFIITCIVGTGGSFSFVVCSTYGDYTESIVDEADQQAPGDTMPAVDGVKQRAKCARWVGRCLLLGASVRCPWCSKVFNNADTLANYVQQRAVTL